MFSVARRAASLSARAGVRSYATPAGSSDFKFSFVLPHASVYNHASVDSVIVPTEKGVTTFMTGVFGQFDNLAPGVVEVTESKGGEKKKYFISGGVSLMHETSNLFTLNAVEGAPLEDFDASAARSNLAEAQANVAKAKTDLERVAAGIDVQVQTALLAALNAK